MSAFGDIPSEREVSGDPETAVVQRSPDEVFARLESTLSEWGTRLTATQHTVSERLAELQHRHENALIAHENTLHELQFAREADQAAVAEARATIAALNQVIARREEELASAHQQVAQLKEAVVKLYAEIQGHRVRAEQEIANRQAVQDEMEAARAETAGAREELRRVREQALLVRERLSATENQLAESENRLEEMKSASQRIADLETAVEAERTRVAGLNGEIRSRDEAKAALLRQIDDIKGERDRALHEVSLLQIRIDALQELDTAAIVPPTAPVAPASNPTIHAFEADGRRKRLGEILTGMGMITQEQLEQALQTQDGKPQTRLGAIFVEMGIAEEELVARVVARQLDLSFVRLTPETVDPDAIWTINSGLAKRRNCIPIAKAEDHLVVAMANPLDLIALDEIEAATGQRVEPVMATLSDITKAIPRHYGLPE